VIAAGERQGDLANTVQLDGHARVDAMAAYGRPVGGTQLMLQINVNNLFDVRYYSSGGSRTSLYPGRPRNLVASARVAF
jgi:iron complex outermembrane recepter protein